jgi:hypothetical protein
MIVQTLWPRYHILLNVLFGLPPHPNEVPVKRRVFWLATECNASPLHVVYKSGEAAADRPQGLTCTVCSDISKLKKRGRCRTIDVINEPKLWRLMDAVFPHCIWAVQCRAVVGWNGDVDMVIFVDRDHKLMVEVDGFCHESEDRGVLGDTLQEQLDRDARFNDTALEGHHRVLRLHPDDYDLWAGLIAQAMVVEGGQGEWAVIRTSPKCRA